MIFPLRVFGSASAKRTSSGFAIAPMCLSDVVAQLFFQARSGLHAAFQRHENDHALAFEFVRAAHRGGFRDSRVTNERAFDFRSAKAMAGDVQHVVDPAQRSRSSRPCRVARRRR